MTRYDELQNVCAWGRCRIGRASNEPMPMRSERRALDHGERVRSTRSAEQRARLRLVADADRTLQTTR